MKADVKIASSLSAVPPPLVPDFEQTAASFPALHRPIYHRAIALAELNSPVVHAIAACLMLSLIEEEAAFREDLRIRTLQMFFWLRMRTRGERLLAAWPPAQSAHNREQFQAAQTAFATLEERPLEAWFTGPARITRALMPLIDGTPGAVLFCGPTTVLSMLYGNARAFFSLKLPEASVVRERFFDRLPATIAIAEAGLQPGDVHALFTSYTTLPVTRLIAVLRADDGFELEGFERHAHEFDLPISVPHSLNGDPIFRASLGEPSMYAAGSDPNERYAAFQWVRK